MSSIHKLVSDHALEIENCELEIRIYPEFIISHIFKNPLYFKFMKISEKIL